MNWAKYLVNQLDIDCREAQDQGHEFHFRWLLILIAFIAWELLEDATFPDLDPFLDWCSFKSDLRISGLVLLVPLVLWYFWC
jgi:hypothetical protein